MPDIKISLRKLRVELGNISQEKFAKLIDMPVSTYRKKEVGETSLTLDEAYRISKLMNKSIDEIFFNSK